MLGVLAIILYRRKKEGKRLLPLRESPPRPPHEIAVEALDRLRDSDLLEKGKIKAYYTEISEIIRRYIEGRYFIVALEMTTTDVLDGLSREDVFEEDYDLFQMFLDRCDLVKFAKMIPTAEENEEILRLAYEIVDRTKVLFEAEPEEDVGEIKEKADVGSEVEEEMEEVATEASTGNPLTLEDEGGRT